MNDHVRAALQAIRECQERVQASATVSDSEAMRRALGYLKAAREALERDPE